MSERVFKPRVCRDCRITFVPTGTREKRCLICQREHRARLQSVRDRSSRYDTDEYREWNRNRMRDKRRG